MRINDILSFARISCERDGPPECYNQGERSKQGPFCVNDIEKLYALQLIDAQRLRIVRQVKNLLEQTKEPQDLVELRSKVDLMQQEQEMSPKHMKFGVLME